MGCSGKDTTVDDEGASTPAATTDAAPWFEDVTAAWGIDAVHDAGARGALRIPEIMGSGLALFDADDDGALDLYQVNSAPVVGPGEPPAEGAPNRLFLQRDGAFVEMPGSGLGDRGIGMGVAVGDYDNDGDVDVYLTNDGLDRLFRNRGDGTFDDVTESAGIAVDDWSSSAAFCDVDADGHLDLYVVRYVRHDLDTVCTDTAGRVEYCGPESFPDAHDVLLRNRGDGTFEDVTESAGIGAVTGAGLGVSCLDFDADGHLDLYVANDADPNQLWINHGDGTFRDEGLLRGASVNAQGLNEAGMGVVAGDFDGDDDFDLFVTHLEEESNTYYRNLGGTAGFEDKSASAGLAASSMRFTGFGTAALDADLDGDLDLAAVNGRVKRSVDVYETSMPAPWDRYAEPNLFYRNDGDVFHLLGAEAAAFTAPVEIGRGLAVGDLDGDGDPDLALSSTQGPLRLVRNLAGDRARAAGHRWLLVEARDPALGDRYALGAVVTLELADGRRQTRAISAAASYLSSSDPRALFAFGPPGATGSLVVRWPGGVAERFAVDAFDRVLVVRRGGGSPVGEE